MMLDLLTKEERHAYSPEKHYLGVLCKRSHDAGNGRSWRHKGHDNCIECCREAAREWRKANPDRAAASTKRCHDAAGLRRISRQTHPISTLVGNARSRAKAAGIIYDLTTDQAKLLWRDQAGRCFWTGRSLDFFIGGDRHPMRPSLDRLVPALGYTKDNIVWASNFANRARGDLDATAFAELMVGMGFAQAAHRFMQEAQL